MSEAHKFIFLKKGEFIFFPGDAAEKIYLITEGSVRIGHYLENGKEVIKAILGRGEIFGELALAGETHRTDFAQAMDKKTTLCPMTLQDLKALMYQNRDLSLTLLKLVGLRLRKLERKLELLVFRDARTRIVEFLKDIALDSGEKVGHEILIYSKLTHSDIASLTGTSRQTTSSVLNELKAKNLIYFDRKKILIRDFAKLSQFVLGFSSSKLPFEQAV